MSDDPNALITQMQRGVRRWRAAAILTLVGLLMLVSAQTLFFIELRERLTDMHGIAEAAHAAATEARDDAQEARRVASETAREVSADKTEELARTFGAGTDGQYLYPTDQMYRGFNF